MWRRKSFSPILWVSCELRAATPIPTNPTSELNCLKSSSRGAWSVSPTSSRAPSRLICWSGRPRTWLSGSGGGIPSFASWWRRAGFCMKPTTPGTSAIQGTRRHCGKSETARNHSSSMQPRITRIARISWGNRTLAARERQCLHHTGERPNGLNRLVPVSFRTTSVPKAWRLYKFCRNRLLAPLY
jgi:hypothetical protein